MATAAPDDAPTEPVEVHQGEVTEELTLGEAPPETPWEPDWDTTQDVSDGESEPAPEEEPKDTPDPDADGTTAPDDAPVGEPSPDVAPEAKSQTPEDEPFSVQSLNGPVPNAGGGINSTYSYQEFPIFGDAMQLQVNIGTGNLFARSGLISLSGAGVPATVAAVYNSNSNVSGDLGNWRTDANSVGLTSTGPTEFIYYDGTGARHVFTKDTSTGTWNASPGLNASLTVGRPSNEITYNRTGEKLRFNSSGWIQSRVDRNGVGVNYGYSGTQLVSVTDAANKTLQLGYNQAKVNSVTDGTGRAAVTTVQNGTTLTQLNRPGSGQFAFTYTGGKLTGITLHDLTAQIAYSGDRVTWVKQTKSGQPTLTTTFTYTSQGTDVKDARGNTSKFHVNDKFQVTKTVDPLNRTREQEWTPNGDVAMATSGYGAGGTGNETTYGYDSLNNQTSITLPTGAATQALYAQGPNCAGAQSGNPYLPKCTIDDAGNTESMTYDTAGNLTARTNTTAGGAGESDTYTRENSSGTVCGGKAGQVCSSKDGKGNETKYTYQNGVVIKVTPPAPLGATTYAYDGVHRVKSVTNGAGHKTSYTYDNADRIVKTTYNGGATLVTQYNVGGAVTSETDSTASKSITYTLNVLGLTTQQQMTGSPTVDMVYDNNGNMTKFTTGSTSTNYAYDAANQMTRLSTPGGNCSGTGNPGCILYSYDSDGQESARVFPQGARQDTTRDEAGRPTRITAKDKNGTVQNDVAYSYAAGSADRFSVQARTSHKEAGISAGAVTSYTYDSRSRLTKAAEVGTSGSAVVTWEYAYDKADNRTKLKQTGPGRADNKDITYTYNAANQITAAPTQGSSGSWTYDGAGNQTRNANSGATATYGDRLQVTANGTKAYSTFGQGNNRQLTVGGVAQQQTALGVHSYAPSKTVYRAGDGTAVAETFGSTTGFLATDHLGSTIGIFNADGTYRGGHSYDPYGGFRGSDNSVSDSIIRYIGEQLEPGTGLYKLGARYYDTSLGRFTQMDPSGQEGNPYTYGTCDPINGSDPTGLDYACEVAVGAIWYANAAVWAIALTGPVGVGVGVGLALTEILVSPLMC